MLDTVFMQVLDMTKAASIVIIFVLLARLLLKKAPKVFSYALWAVVLFRLLCPVTIEAPVSVVPEMKPVAESYTLADTPISFVGASDAAQQAVGDMLNGGLGTQHIQTTIPAEENSTEVVSSLWWEVWILFGQYIWLVGIGLMAIYSIISYLLLRRKLVGAVPLRDNIYLADYISSPFVMGFFRPAIYLPASLSGQEQDYIILHEQHHIRRKDHLIKGLAFLALCIHWFNPLVWLAFTLSSKDMEMSCDEAVVRQLGQDIRADYSASLLSLATGRRVIAGTPLAFGEGDTKSRIKNMLNWKQAKPAVMFLSAAAVILAVVLCGTNAATKGSWVKTNYDGPAVEAECHLEEPICSYAFYEDIYEEGKLISSQPCILDQFQGDGGASPRHFTMTLRSTAVHSTPTDGFAGELSFSWFSASGIRVSKTTYLPKEHYTGVSHVFPEMETNLSGKHTLEGNDSVTLMYVLLSTAPDGGTVVKHRDLTLIESNDTVVVYRLVTSEEGLDSFPMEGTPPSAGETALAEFLSTLQSSDIGHMDYTMGGRTAVDAVVSALRSAVSHPVHRESMLSSGNAFWYLTLYLGDPNTSGWSGRDALHLYAGLEENIVEVFGGENLPQGRIWVEDETLYSLVRHSSDYEEIVDKAAFTRFENILTEKMELHLQSMSGNLGNFTGYQLTRFNLVWRYENPGGSIVELYDFDYALLPESIESIGWAGGMYLDSQLRVQGFNGGGQFAVNYENGQVTHTAFMGNDFYYTPADTENEDWAKERLNSALGISDEVEEPAPAVDLTTFSRDGLLVEVSGVQSVRKETMPDDGGNPHEYQVFTCYPGAAVYVKRADMHSGEVYEDGQPRPKWGLYYTGESDRTRITNETDSFPVTPELEGIYHLEASLFVLKFELVGAESTPEPAGRNTPFTHQPISWDTPLNGMFERTYETQLSMLGSIDQTTPPFFREQTLEFEECAILLGTSLDLETSASYGTAYILFRSGSLGQLPLPVDENGVVIQPLTVVDNGDGTLSYAVSAGSDLCQYTVYLESKTVSMSLL